MAYNALIRVATSAVDYYSLVKSANDLAKTCTLLGKQLVHTNSNPRIIGIVNRTRFSKIGRFRFVRFSDGSATLTAIADATSGGWVGKRFIVTQMG